MKKETLLTVSVITLLLLNLGTLSFLFFAGRPPHFAHNGPPPPNELIVNELKLNDTQQTRFDKMRQEHHEAMKTLDEENRHLVEQYFKLINISNPDTVLKDSIEKQISAIQFKKASITFNHFSELKKICTEEQKKRFDTLLPRLIFMLTAPPPNGRPFHEH